MALIKQVACTSAKLVLCRNVSDFYHIFTSAKQRHLHAKGHPKEPTRLKLSDKIRDTTSQAFTIHFWKLAGGYDYSTGQSVNGANSSDFIE